MSLQIILTCGWVALIGSALHFFIEANDVQKTSLKANVEFKLGRYFRDQKISIIVSLLTIVLAMFTAEEFLNWKAGIMGWKNSVFAFIGFSSDFLANLIFGVGRKRLVAAIDFKTTVADQVSGTLSVPTPSTLPSDKK